MQGQLYITFDSTTEWDMQNDSIGRPFKQDPQSNLSICIKEGICEISFLVWGQNDQEIQDYKGRLTFSDSWACEHVRTETYPHPEQKESCSSEVFLWKLTQSSWFKEKIDQRSKVYPNWPNWDKREYSHYLIEGHDNYVQVIASGFKIDLVSQT